MHHSVKVAETLQELYECSLSCRGHTAQPLAASGHQMMEGLCLGSPRAENHPLDPWQDLENRLRPLLWPAAHILKPINQG